MSTLGDGLTAAFSSPHRALDCALAIQADLEEHARRSPDERLRLRIGLHTGVISRPAIDLSGVTVSAALRICGRAEGGQILVSEVVRQLCAGHGEASFEDRGRVTLRGLPDRWRLYRATSGAGRRGLAPGERTPFVGRRDERAELLALADRARAGHGTLVLLGGEPGVGKTRLVDEVVAAGLDRGLVAHTGHCYEARGDLPYMPWVEIIEAAARRVRPAALLETFGDAAPELARVVPELRRLVPQIPAPLPLPPDQQRRYTFATIGAHVVRVARRRPQLYVLEDLHWADESTLLFLEHLAGLIPDIPLLVIGTFRDAARRRPRGAGPDARRPRRRRGGSDDAAPPQRRRGRGDPRGAERARPAPGAGRHHPRRDRRQRLLRRGGLPPLLGDRPAARRQRALPHRPAHRRA